jgi:preprotein translocase subunit SecF
MDFRGKNIDLVGRLRLWFGISLVTIAIGLFSWAAFGLNLGIDFKGGGQLQYRIPADQRPTAGQDVELLNSVRESLEAKGLRGTKLQVAGGDTLVVQTPARGDAELSAQERVVSQVLAQTWKVAPGGAGAASLAPLSRELVGPVIGKELRNNAIKGVLLGVLAIAGWIYIRYNFAGGGARYAVAGIVALFHDVLVLIGIFALIGRIDPRVEIDGAFIAALLTVVGYSINDSVVIFDRLRENLRSRRKEPFNKIVNDSLLETMSRSINTGLTVVIMLLVLLFLGGESIYNFVLAMVIGIVSGLYSSIFNASMVLVAWNNWDEKKRLVAAPVRASVRAGAARPSARPLSTSAPSASGAALSSRNGLAASSIGQSATPRPAAPSAGTATFEASELQSDSSAPSAVASSAGAGSASPSAETSGEDGSTDENGEERNLTAAQRASRKARSKRRF